MSTEIPRKAKGGGDWEEGVQEVSPLNHKVGGDGGESSGAWALESNSNTTCEEDTLGKSLNLALLWFLTCKMGLMTVSIS